MGPVVACLLWDDLFARALAGDERAQQILAAASPAVLPAGIRRAERDHRIRGLANKLRSLLPGIEARALAKMLATAGRQLGSGGRSLRGRPFRDLDDAERDEVAAVVRDVLRWAPPTKGGGCWPSADQISRIISSN